MKKKIKNSKNQESIVSHTANQLHATKWVSLKKRLVDLIRTVTVTLDGGW
jgi:hypothetical protein